MDNRFQLALEEARKVDKLIESGEKDVANIATETPFLGVPFTIKGELGKKDVTRHFNWINHDVFYQIAFQFKGYDTPQVW